MRLLHKDPVAPPKARPSRPGPDATPSPRDTIYFDGTCGMCTGTAKRLHRIVSPRGFALEPFQNSTEFSEVPEEMKLRTRDGRLLGGGDAIVYVCRHIWWAWPMWVMSFIPGMMPLLRWCYRKLARNRYRISGACRIDR